MGNLSAINSVIEKKLMDLHCGYIGKVISTDGKTAKVQPLGLIKEYGTEATKKQAVVDNVPVACRYKLSTKDITYVTSVSGNAYSVSSTKETTTVAIPREIRAGDLVACLCADRDITEARRGNNELPPVGRHSISDSIIVGIL